MKAVGIGDEDLPLPGIYRKYHCHVPRMRVTLKRMGQAKKMMQAALENIQAASRGRVTIHGKKVLPREPSAVQPPLPTALIQDSGQRSHR
jgi:hypothetical protein